MFNPFEERNQKIVEEFLEYKTTLQEIADKYGITRERVRQIASRCGYDRNRSVFLEKNKIDWVKIRRMARAIGLANRTIATGVGCNYETVKHIFYGDRRYRYGITAEKVLLYVLGKVLKSIETIDKACDFGPIKL